MNVTRWCAHIYIMVCLAISVKLQAQEKHAPLQKQVRITNTLFSLDSLSGLISTQTGIFLSFNSNKLAADKKIVTQKRLYTLEELLELIKSNTGSSYKMYQDHVIFHGGDKNNKQRATAAKVVKEKHPSGKAQNPLKPATINSSKETAKEHYALSNKNTTTENNKEAAQAPLSNKNTTTENNKNAAKEALSNKNETKEPLSTKNITIENNKNTPHSNNPEIKEPLAIIPLEPIKLKAPKPSITLTQKPSFTIQRPPVSPRTSTTRWFADGGFTVDEVLYLNPYISAGHKYLHGFFSWSSSFKVSGFRYGLGSMVPVNDEWRIGLLVTTGKLNREIEFTGVRDTLKNITVKSQLHRVAIQVEKSLRPDLIVKAGPVFNLLKSSYYQEGKPVTVATSGYEGANADRELYTVRPLYTLSNSYKETTPDNTKTWIGFQVSLCYRFNF